MNKEKLIALIEDHVSIWRVFAVAFLALGVTCLLLDIPGQAVMLLFTLALDMMHEWEKQGGRYG